MAEPNLGIVALARTVKNSLIAGQLADNWKMSNAERRELCWIVDVRDMAIDLDWCKTQIVASSIERQWIYDLLWAYERYDELRELEVWETPVFPMNGNDLIDLGYRPGPDLGYELNRRKQWWLETNCTMTRDELLSYL